VSVLPQRVVFGLQTVNLLLLSLETFDGRRRQIAVFHTLDRAVEVVPVVNDFICRGSRFSEV
jgi:hypothetical protein